MSQTTSSFIDVEAFMRDKEICLISNPDTLLRVKNYVAQIKPDFQWYKGEKDYYDDMKSKLGFISYEDRITLGNIIDKYRKPFINPVYANYLAAQKMFFDNWKIQLITKYKFFITNEELNELKSYISQKYHSDLFFSFSDESECDDEKTIFRSQGSKIFKSHDELVSEWLTALKMWYDIDSDTFDFISEVAYENKSSLTNPNEFYTKTCAAILSKYTMIGDATEDDTLDSMFAVFPILLDTNGSSKASKVESSGEKLEKRLELSYLEGPDYDYPKTAMQEVEEILEIWFCKCFKEAFITGSDAIIIDDNYRGFRTVIIDIRNLKPIGFRSMNFKDDLSKVVKEMKYRPGGEFFHDAEKKFVASLLTSV